MFNIVPSLLKDNCLYNKRSRFILPSQNVFALFMEHIVNTSVEYITGTDFDCSVHSTFINNSHNFIKTSLNRCCIMAKLK